MSKPDTKSAAALNFAMPPPNLRSALRDCIADTAGFQPNAADGNLFDFAMRGAVMKRCLVLGALIGIGSLSMLVAGFQAPPAGPTPAALAATKIERIKDNLYIIT